MCIWRSHPKSMQRILNSKQISSHLDTRNKEVHLVSRTCYFHSFHNNFRPPTTILTMRKFVTITLIKQKTYFSMFTLTIPIVSIRSYYNGMLWSKVNVHKIEDRRLCSLMAMSEQAKRMPLLKQLCKKCMQKCMYICIYDFFFNAHI